MKKLGYKQRKTSVIYLGHVIDSEGLHPIVERVKAVEGAPVPQGIHQLKSYLGLLTYYGKISPKYGNVASPTLSIVEKGCYMGVGND